tara:strand:- start:22 stop:639 length:618 start_codon:yes stop_codon:yes gene_type:complete
MVDKISIILLNILIFSNILTMQIMGYEISKTHMYIIGGLGFGSRLAISLINQSYSRDKKIEKHDEIPKYTTKGLIQAKNLIADEGINTVNSMLLDNVELKFGEDSNTVRLLFTEEKNNKTIIYLIYGNFVSFKNSWRFISNKVEIYNDGKVDSLNCAKIQGDYLPSNCGSSEDSSYFIDGSNVLNQLPENIGLKLNKHCIIKLQN